MQVYVNASPKAFTTLVVLPGSLLAQEVLLAFGEFYFNVSTFLINIVSKHINK